MTHSPDHRNASGHTASARDEADARQDTAQQQEKQALEQHRRQPSPSEEQVRREQGGHDRPVGGDQVPHRRPQAEPTRKGAGTESAEAAQDSDQDVP